MRAARAVAVRHPPPPKARSRPVAVLRNPYDPGQMRSLKSRLRRPLLGLIERLAGRLGYRLSERGYYSPLLDPETLPRDLWSEPRQTPGLSIEPSEHLDFLERELAPYVREFDPPHRLDGTRGGGFYLHNGFYGSVDAEVLYAAVRRTKPQRIVEVGSRHSTLVIAEAIAANERERRPARYRVFDPYAGDHLRVEGPGPVEIARTPATRSRWPSSRPSPRGPPVRRHDAHGEDGGRG